MKVLIVGDIHWSTYSSIVRSRGKYFSTRLEHLIRSMNWVERIAKVYNCQEEIFLGDTFDKPDLTSEEISALSCVDWNDLQKHFIVGNHESGLSSLAYNSTQALHKVGVIEDTPNVYPVDDATEFLFLPYITEDNRKPLADYLKNRVKDKKMIVFSHNDIKDFQMGMFLSKTGFSIDEINENCDLYLNGHLHNAGFVNDKIINVGVLCGQNFSEDAFRYEHHVMVLDTDTMTYEFIENPEALNFYKLTIGDEQDLIVLDKLKNNAVVSIKCHDTVKQELLKKLDSTTNILESKVIYYSDVVNSSDKLGTADLQFADHLNKFKEFVIEKLGSTATVLEELEEVCK